MTEDELVRIWWMKRAGLSDPTMWDGLLPSEREWYRERYMADLRADQDADR